MSDLLIICNLCIFLLKVMISMFQGSKIHYVQLAKCELNRISKLQVKFYVIRKGLQVEFFIVTLPGKKCPFHIWFQSFFLLYGLICLDQPFLNEPECRPSKT